METRDANTTHTYHIHEVLAHSYMMYFVLFLIGICLDLFFNLNFLNYLFVIDFGILFLVVGTFLILWSQKTSRSLNKENINKDSFTHGPYHYTRSPTHAGLFFLMLGAGMVTNAFFVVLLSFISFIIAKFTFLEKEEKLLAEKYGNPYIEYKKSVKF